MSTEHGFQDVAPGVLQWSVFHEEKGLNFNGTFLPDEAGGVVVDPPELTPDQLAWTWERGGIAHVVLTTSDHARRTGEIAQRTGAKVHVHAKDAPALHVPFDETFKGGAELPGGFLAVELRGTKTPGEVALLLPRDGGTLLLGDALIGDPPGSLRLLPPEKLPDQKAALAGLRPLLKLEFERVLVGDGVRPERGRAALEDFLAHHGVHP